MQTWKTLNVPKKWLCSPKSIQKHFSDWKYVFLTDESNDLFVKTRFPHLHDWFKKLPFAIQRADVIRYLWLYENGGLYIDLDIEILSNPKELFVNGDLFLLKAPRNFAGHYTNFFMASSAKNKFWLRVIDECLKPLDWWVVLPHHIISQQTGLGAITRAANSWERPISILPQNQFVPCDYCDPTSCSKPFSYTRFLKGQSWNGVDTHIINFFACHPDIFLILMIYFMWFLYRK
jgi:mannosyltransferase OCH1-like enzyme